MKSTANKDGCMREPWNAFAVCSALYVDGVLPIDVLLTLAESVSSRPHRGFWRERAVSVCCSIDITAVSLTESSGRRTSRGGGLPSFWRSTDHPGSNLLDQYTGTCTRDL